MGLLCFLEPDRKAFKENNRHRSVFYLYIKPHVTNEVTLFFQMFTKTSGYSCYNFRTS